MGMDPFLIFTYRMFQDATAGFFFGTALLSFYCVILGKMTLSILSLVNRSYHRGLKSQTVTMHNLSVKAILRKDKDSYRACNQQANDAFGKYFFSQIGLGASALWPLPFAMGWMSLRFNGIDFKLLGTSWTLGFAGIFILLYILIRIATGYLFDQIPFVKRRDKVFSESGEERMVNWKEVELHGGFPEADASAR